MKMNTIIVILSLIIVICLILIILASMYNHFQDYIIRINEAEVNIDAVLRKRFDLLNKSISIIKSNTKTDKDILEPIVKLRSQKLSNFELDRNLYVAINEFHAIKEEYVSLQTCKEFIKIEIDLLESESEIVGLRKYYNDIITDYNKLVKSCPSNIIAINDSAVINKIIEDCNKQYKIYINSSNVKKGMAAIPVKRESKSISISVNTKLSNPKGAMMIADHLAEEINKYDIFIEYTSNIRNKLEIDKKLKLEILSFINTEDFKYIFDKGKADGVLKMFYPKIIFK